MNLVLDKLTEEIVQDEALLHATLFPCLERLGTLKNIKARVTSELLECFFVADDSVIDLTTNAPASPDQDVCRYARHSCA